MASKEVVFCIDCGTKNVQRATYCFKCGSKLEKNEETDHDTQQYTEPITTPKETANTQNTKNDNNTQINVDSEFQIGKYLYIGIKGAKPICSKITSVQDTGTGTLVSLENNATFLFDNNPNPPYTFYKILNEPYESKCKCASDTEWNNMNKSQKRFIIALILITLMIDTLYITAWSINQLTVLGDDINCGVSSLYDTSNDNEISYKTICDNGGNCDMLEYGKRVLICSIVGFVLQNILIWFCVLVNIFYDRFFMKSTCHTCSIFVGFVVGGVITLFAISTWDGKRPSKCSSACEYLINDVNIGCSDSNGISQNIFITIEAFCIFCGAVFPAISSSKTFIVN